MSKDFEAKHHQNIEALNPKIADFEKSLKVVNVSIYFYVKISILLVGREG
jgi:hypothetical protein